MKDKKRFTNSRKRFLDESVSLGVENQINNNVFQCCIATEEPILVGEYYEVLDIDAMNINRLIDSGPVLFDHDPANYIGVITRVWKENKKLYAEFRFSNNSFAQQVKQDVIDKVLNKLSIGYVITSFQHAGQKDGLDVMRCVSEALEFSIVTQPADVNCKITSALGRSLTKRDLQEQINELTNNEESIEMDELVKLINDLTAKIDAMQKSLDEVKEKVNKPEQVDETKIDETLESRKKRELEDNKKEEDKKLEESRKKREITDENGNVVADDVAKAEVDQDVIDKAVEDITAEIADATDAEVNIDDIVAEIQDEINDVVDEKVEELDDEVVEEVV